MAKSKGIILQFIVVVACMLSVSHGYSECDCSCNATRYGVTDVCNLVARSMIIAERNAGRIQYLKKKYQEEISPFIRPHLSTSTTTAPAKTETPTNIPTADTGILEEIQKLKKQFENEQLERRRLEGKIASLEKHCLETKDDPSGHIEESEEKKLQVKNELLERLIVAENRISGHIEESEKKKLQVENELLERLIVAENRISGHIEESEKKKLQVENELLERLIVAENRILGHMEESEEKKLQLENELLERIFVAEDRISEVNFVVLGEIRKEEERSLEIEAKVSNIESEILKVKDEVFGRKANGTANATSQLKDGSLKGTDEAEENMINELVMQVEKGDFELNEMRKAEETDESHLEEMLNEIRHKLTHLEEMHNKTDREEIIPEVEDLKLNEHLDIYSRLNALEMKSYRRDKALEDLQATLENYTKVESRGNLYKEISGVVFDTFQAMDNYVFPTAEEFREKSAHLNEVFVNSFSEDFSTASDVTVERTRPDDDDEEDNYEDLRVHDPCRDDASIDAVTRTQDESTYFFKGDFYWKHLSNDTIAYGYPRKIADDWDGLEGNLDAALFWLNDKTYFFKGEIYWRFTNKKMDPNYPRLMSFSRFKGIPSGIDAAYLWKRRGQAYFFKGGQYWLYDVNKNPPVSDEYPRPIFEGLPQDGVDAAVQWENDRTYIFVNNSYYRIAEITLRVESEQGYPLITSRLWFSC